VANKCCNSFPRFVVKHPCLACVRLRSRMCQWLIYFIFSLCITWKTRLSTGCVPIATYHDNLPLIDGFGMSSVTYRFMDSISPYQVRSKIFSFLRSFNPSLHNNPVFYAATLVLIVSGRSLGLCAFVICYMRIFM